MIIIMSFDMISSPDGLPDFNFFLDSTNSVKENCSHSRGFEAGPFLSGFIMLVIFGSCSSLPNTFIQLSGPISLVKFVLVKFVL